MSLEKFCNVLGSSKALSVDRLNQQQLFSLCTLPQIQHYVTTMDISFYQVIVDILVPSVLMSQMTREYCHCLSVSLPHCSLSDLKFSANLTQMCRSFAKSAESSLKTALKGAPEMLQKKKIQAVKYLSQGLRRYTSLNHLAQAAKAVLLKAEQVQCMFNDYVKLDPVSIFYGQNLSGLTSIMSKSRPAGCVAVTLWWSPRFTTRSG